MKDVGLYNELEIGKKGALKGKQRENLVSLSNYLVQRGQHIDPIFNGNPGKEEGLY